MLNYQVQKIANGVDIRFKAEHGVRVEIDKNGDVEVVGLTKPGDPFGQLEDISLTLAEEAVTIAERFCKRTLPMPFRRSKAIEKANQTEDSMFGVWTSRERR